MCRWGLAGALKRRHSTPIRHSGLFNRSVLFVVSAGGPIKPVDFIRIVLLILCVLFAYGPAQSSLDAAEIKIYPTACYSIDSTTQAVTTAATLSVRSGNYLSDETTPDESRMILSFDIPRDFVATAAKIVVSGKVTTPDFPGNFLGVYSIDPTSLPTSYADRLEPTNDAFIYLLNQADPSLDCLEWQVYEADMEGGLPQINSGKFAVQIYSQVDPTVLVLDDTLIASSSYPVVVQRPYLELTSTTVPEPRMFVLLAAAAAMGAVLRGRVKGKRLTIDRG